MLSEKFEDSVDENRLDESQIPMTPQALKLVTTPASKAGMRRSLLPTPGIPKPVFGSVKKQQNETEKEFQNKMLSMENGHREQTRILEEKLMEMKNELKNRVSGSNQERDTLQATVKELKNELTSMEEQNVELKEELIRLRDEEAVFKNSEKEIIQMTKFKQRFYDCNEELTQLKETMTTMQSQREFLVEANADLESKNKMAESFREELKRVKQNLTEEKKRYECLGDELQLTQLKNGKLSSELERCKEEIIALKKEHLENVSLSLSGDCDFKIHCFL
eukprot:TRINITY_DN5956_c0_g1_i2.p1 TRINITY_DN5956_c0_g1~~TRINITY_DN5956_c0_g1_i2.p1  ORF type:complete len:318 (-),score=86.15 TRINITY_DN5956_c0_g1_i2:42-875(-)